MPRRNMRNVEKSTRWKFCSFLQALVANFIENLLFQYSSVESFFDEKLMTSLLQPPGAKARSRKDLSAGSIPTLVEEEYNYSPPRLTANGNETSPEVRKYSDSSLPSAIAYKNTDDEEKPTKASRRSSLGLGLLGGKSDSNKSGKRRSSIAVVFLGGRRNSKVCNNVVARRGLKSMHLSFRNFTVEGTGEGERGEVSTEIIRIRHGKWPASDDYHHAGLRAVSAGEKASAKLIMGNEDGET